MWGVSDDETNDPYTNAPPEEDEEVIESVLDHRKKGTATGKSEKYTYTLKKRLIIIIQMNQMIQKPT